MREQSAKGVASERADLTRVAIFTRPAAENARGVIGCALRVAALADENGGRPVTSRHTGAGEPVEVYGAGVSVAAGLLRESTRVCVLAEVPPDRRREARVASRSERRGHGGHVRPGSWA
jgi:hypothetical protein